jgi:two-component system, OmpR family, response regulator
MRLRIFLVEDNPVLSKSLADWFEEIKDVRLVGLSSTEKEATQWFAEHMSKWDLAVIDLFLSEGSGLGVVKALRERALRQKVVILTNYATPVIRERSLLLGADAVFDKSTQLEEFMRYALGEVERQQGDTNV